MATAAMAGMMVFYWTFGIIGYLYYAFCLMTIARKLGAKDPWMAWVPILNFYLMTVLAEKPAWWIILFFIPLVNIVAILIVYEGSARGAAARAGGPFCSSSRSST